MEKHQKPTNTTYLNPDFDTKDQVLSLLMTSKKETIATITAATTKAKHYK